MRLGYHITEDLFVEATLRQHQGQRRSLPPDPARRHLRRADSEKLSYYNVSAGYNVLPGEVFLGAKRAKASAIYLIGGVGSTNFNDQRRQTFNFGLGVRVLLNDRFALQVDVRDHIFSLDLLGKSPEHAEPRADRRPQLLLLTPRHERP